MMLSRWPESRSRRHTDLCLTQKVDRESFSIGMRQLDALDSILGGIILLGRVHMRHPVEPLANQLATLCEDIAKLGQMCLVTG